MVRVWRSPSAAQCSWKVRLYPAPLSVRTRCTRIRRASKNAMAVGAGHFFIIFLREAYPINVLRALRDVPEIVTIHAATANPVDVVVAKTPRGRGVLGVVDGERAKGVESEKDRAERIAFLRKIGYKLG